MRISDVCSDVCFSDLEHFYRIQRLVFGGEMSLDTAGQAHILNLVEGESVLVITESRQLLVRYAETFVIPANAGSYRVINHGASPARIVRAFVKRSEERRVGKACVGTLRSRWSLYH